MNAVRYNLLFAQIDLMSRIVRGIFLYLNIDLSAWIAVQNSIIIKLMSHRSKNSLERDKELYLQNMRNLLLLIRTVENARNEK